MPFWFSKRAKLLHIGLFALLARPVAACSSLSAQKEPAHSDLLERLSTLKTLAHDPKLALDVLSQVAKETLLERLFAQPGTGAVSMTMAAGRDTQPNFEVLRGRGVTQVPHAPDPLLGGSDQVIKSSNNGHRQHQPVGRE